MNDDGVVKFRATTAKFTTLVDGTRRVYIDLLGDTPYSVDAAMIETQQPGIILDIALVATMQENGKENATNGRKIHI